ncbi:hypothetical protein BKA62DRAFT_829528 [Auriculariales sp. MPI-PUGE-AT-0066]|nr:hypothetical protein BKA62DRAFT_829528 [Auriculariales sp. MPI-PUGE-AT-0066]
MRGYSSGLATGSLQQSSPPVCFDRREICILSPKRMWWRYERASTNVPGSFFGVWQRARRRSDGGPQAALGTKSQLQACTLSIQVLEETLECALLVQALGSNAVSFPGSPAYAATEAAYWSLQEAQLYPSMHRQGHAPAAGFANIDGGGVSIDLSGLNRVEVSADGAVVSVGAGATSLAVYAALDPWNVTAAVGRNGAVGVGGFLTGGGISYVSPRVGWACDSLVNVEVVLASGEIVDANATSNPDLFWALKGGSNNFGIVTRFDLRTVTTGGGIVAGAISSPFEERQAVFDAFTSFANSSNYDPNATLITSLTYRPSGGGWQAVNSKAVYTHGSSTATAQTAFAPFLGVPNTTHSLQPTQLSVFANESATPPLEWSFHTATYQCSATLMAQISERWQATLAATSIPDLVLWSFTFEPLPTVWTARSNAAETGGNALGVTEAQGNAFIQTGDRLVAEANEVARQMGLLLPFQYLNYANPSQRPVASYNATNVAALHAVSRRYDPQRLFQRRVPGGFKLPPPRS